jgi:aspartate aminotransferase-like enzyme
VSPKALNLIEKSTSPRYYFDLREAKKAAEKTDTPFTPAIGIIIALNEAIRLIKKEGLQNLFARYALMAKATRAAAQAIGLQIFTHESCRSNVLTAISLPANIDGEKLMKIMRDEYGITVAGGQDKLKGKTIRIAHMGMLDEFDIITGFSCLEKVLKKMGHQFELGAGVAAAQKVFNA